MRFPDRNKSAFLDFMNLTRVHIFIMALSRHVQELKKRSIEAISQSECETRNRTNFTCQPVQHLMAEMLNGLSRNDSFKSDDLTLAND